jgi:hypothetical protein
MPEERRKELPQPWQVDYRFLCELIERRIKSAGYRLRERGYVGEIERIYDNSIKVVRAINKFLEVPGDDIDELLDAIVALNIHLKFYSSPVSSSRRFRDRLQNHIGWTAELVDARPATEAERGILDRLLDAEFPGSEEIRRQLQECLVKTVDENGSLALYPDDPCKVAVADSIPVWGEVRDEDGATVFVRLHVIEGWVKELEITGEDGSRVIRPPEADRLTVHHLG